MKILDFLNVSNLSNLQADSGFVFQRLLLNEILARKKDWEVYLIAPECLGDLGERIHLVKLDYGHNKYEARFNFPWAKLRTSLEGVMQDIDLIYVNQAEHASSFRAFATAAVPSRRIPIVSYFHYLPVEPPHFHFDFSTGDYDRTTDLEGKVQSSSLRFDQSLNLHGLALPVFMRLIEAMFVSDYCVTCSEFGIDLLVGNAQKLVPTVMPKIAAIPPPVSLAEAEPGRTAEKDRKNKIVFNHRLYSHYGPREFFDFMDWFYENRRTDFEVVLTDPTNGRSAERNKLDTSVAELRRTFSAKPYVRFAHSPERDEYYRALGSYKMSIAPFRPSALWSMSVVDSMACGIPVVCPNYACFPEIIGANSELLFSKPTELADLLGKLFDDEPFYRACSQYCATRAAKFSVEKAAERFISIFEEVTLKNGS